MDQLPRGQESKRSNHKKEKGKSVLPLIINYAPRMKIHSSFPHQLQHPSRLTQRLNQMWTCGCVNVPPWWSSESGQSRFVYTMSLRVGTTSTLLLQARRCVRVRPHTFSPSLLPCLPALSVCCSRVSPLPRRAEGAVWYLRGRTGWVTYEL